MKPRVFLLTLLTILFCCTVVYGECPEGENWVKSYTDDVGNTYSLEAPCKVYIEIPFNITATVTSTTCGSPVWVAGAWQIIDNNEYLLYGDGITTPWQKIVNRTYYGIPVNHTIEFHFYDFPGCTGMAHGWDGVLLGDVTVDPYPTSVSYSCLGFEPPLDKSPVKFKKNKALPLKAQLLDTNGLPITDADIIAQPVIQVLHDSLIQGNPIDISNSVLPVGHATDGNQFIFTEEGKWQFNLETKSYKAPGTYTVSMETGDSSEYTIDPTCTVEFVIE